MKKFFREHPEVVLITLALLFAGTIIGTYAWGIGNIVANVNGALKATPTAESTGFNIDQASKLDLRGLTPQ